MDTLNCSKTYSEIPFAHRQWRHSGHCSFIHGHNWTIEVVFECNSLDSNGFVVDFGDLKFIQVWIARHLDHACLLSQDDPELDRFKELEGLGLFKLTLLENASCEGIAKFLFNVFDQLTRESTNDRTWVSRIELYEDTRNKVYYASTN